MSYYTSIALTIAANLFYHVFQKMTSQKVNPLFSLAVTYAVALMVTVLLYPFFNKGESITDSFHNINWASFALGFAIVGLELGFLLAYRAGWNINIGALFSNAAVALLLIPVGMLFFKEGLSRANLIGIFLCLLGLILINKK